MTLRWMRTTQIHYQSAHTEGFVTNLCLRTECRLLFVWALMLRIWHQQPCNYWEEKYGKRKLNFKVIIFLPHFRTELLNSVEVKYNCSIGPFLQMPKLCAGTSWRFSVHMPCFHLKCMLLAENLLAPCLLVCKQTGPWICLPSDLCLLNFSADQGWPQQIVPVKQGFTAPNLKQLFYSVT